MMARLTQEQGRAVLAEIATLRTLTERIVRHCNEMPQCPFCGVDDGEHELGYLCADLVIALSAVGPGSDGVTAPASESAARPGPGLDHPRSVIIDYSKLGKP